MNRVTAPPHTLRTDMQDIAEQNSAEQARSEQDLQAPTQAGVALTPRQAEAVMRVIEAAPGVRRRHHFFVWTQSQLQPLLPHLLLVCGAYQRYSGEVKFEAFHGTVLAPALLALLTQRNGALLGALTTQWIDGGGTALVVPANRMLGEAQVQALQWQTECGVQDWLVLGVARPQRPAEIESLFVFGAPARPACSAQKLRYAELLLPHLHSTWQRVQAAEVALQTDVLPAQTAAGRSPTLASNITERERQILAWARNGKSNLQIGVGLGISPLTVKNHIQKILRKLGANNRAQAVALAMARDLLDSPVENKRLR
jgi:transcriptional regulator EpsA